MTDRITESDLIALIEGDLPADRRAVVGEALRADPELRRRVEGMMRDAQTLSTDRSDPPAAPHGVIARAIDQATEPAPISVPGPRRRRFAVAAIITVAMLGVWGAILYATFGPTATEQKQTVRPKRSVIPNEGMEPVLEQMAKLEEEYFHPDVPLTDDGPIAETPPRDELAEVELDPEMKSMLDDFVAAAKKPADESSFTGAEFLAAILPHGEGDPTLAQVAQAAAEGRLKIIILDGPLPQPGGPLMASADTGEGWRTRAATLSSGEHEFIRDYAKPDPDRATEAPVRHADESRAIRVDLALMGDTPEARTRAAAIALDRLASGMEKVYDSAVHLRFVVLEKPLDGLGPVPSSEGDPADAWHSALPEGSVVSGVLIEREADAESPAAP